MSDSESSTLSSAPPTDDEAEKVIVANLNKPKGLDRYFQPAVKGQNVHRSPPPPKRAPSPPHEYVLADNPDIAFLVMFRARFHDAFPRSVPHLGPQDIEKGVSEAIPSEQVERLLCGLLGLALNRKKDVEKGHYGRALEDAISSHAGQWTGGRDFNAMDATGRLKLLKTLVLWALADSEGIQAIIKTSYNFSRQNDDKNVGLAVIPWFTDTFSKRKYYLVEGREDTHFRLYRENNAMSSKTNTWFSVAGDIDQVQAIADKFDSESASQSKIIAGKIRSAVSRFEAGEEKRKRRDYRLSRKAAFQRPEPGFSLYEGRTRGKRMKYTFSDDELDSDGFSVRRSARNSGVSTPLEDRGQTITASGRQVKSRYAGFYGESMLVDQRKEQETEHGAIIETATEPDADADASRFLNTERLQRSGRAVTRPRLYGDEQESDEESDTPPTEEEWSGNEDDSDVSEPDLEGDDEDDAMSEAESDLGDEDDDGNKEESLVVQLRYRKAGRKSDDLNQARRTLVNGHGRDSHHDEPQTVAVEDPQETISTEPQIENKLSPDSSGHNAATGTVYSLEPREGGGSQPLPNGIGHGETQYPMMT